MWPGADPGIHCLNALLLRYKGRPAGRPGTGKPENPGNTRKEKLEREESWKVGEEKKPIALDLSANRKFSEKEER